MWSHLLGLVGCAESERRVLGGILSREKESGVAKGAKGTQMLECMGSASGPHSAITPDGSP